MDGKSAPHITAPEKEKTEFTILAAKAMKDMPKTTDRSSLKPPLISSLFMMKMTPHSAIATILIHLPAGPVMVFTTCSKGLENSVMPPDAAAISGRQRQSASRPQNGNPYLLGLKERWDLFPETRFVCITVPMEAVMRLVAGASSPQEQAGFAAGTMKLYLSGLNESPCQQAVAVPATNFRKVVCGILHGNHPLDVEDTE